MFHPHPAISPQGRGEKRWIPACAGMTERRSGNDKRGR